MSTTDAPAGHTLTIALSGAYDLANRDELRGQLDGACEACWPTVVLDCAAVALMDAGTLDLVVAARNRQRANGCDLYLSNAAPIVRRVVGLCGLDDLLG